MAHEIETKVLDIDKNNIIRKIKKLGGKGGKREKLVVDWFRTKGVKDGNDKWFLRIRSYNNKKHEVTWKSKSEILGTARKHKEINFFIDSPKELADLFCEIDLENYAHQEKYRTSFVFKGWRFDIDEYPGMPAFIEIEGKSEKHVNDGIKLLDLVSNRTYAEGEKKLIRDIYKLDWFNMKY